MSALGDAIEQVRLGELVAWIKRAEEEKEPDPETPGFSGGGKGPLTFPRDHVAAMRVPKGGSCCKNCEYVDVENHACKNEHYIKWNGGDSSLPKDLAVDEICSDWYELPETA